jgi:antitoxin HigA-1
MPYERQGPAGWAVHPGEILKEEFLRPLNISNYRLAKSIDVNAQAVGDIVLRKRGISAEMAVRLAKFFGTSAEFWMNLQAAYELAQATKTLKKEIAKIRPRSTSAA